MMAARLLDKAVVIRELMPQDLKIEINRLSRQEAMDLARYLAGVVGHAHGRPNEIGTAPRMACRFDEKP
jgi:cytochrome c